MAKPEVRNMLVVFRLFGGVAERFKAPVLTKITGVRRAVCDSLNRGSPNGLATDGKLWSSQRGRIAELRTDRTAERSEAGPAGTPGIHARRKTGGSI